MSKVLFAWELGTGVGHIIPHIDLARSLRSDGHEVLFALRDLTRAEVLLGAEGFTYLQAPYRMRPMPDYINPPCTYAHILHNIGFGDTEGLVAHVKAWRELLQMVQPDLVVLDHSPTALLAMLGLDIRRVVFGTGFVIPPLVSPLPNLRVWDQVDSGKHQQQEQKLLGTMNQVLQRLGRPPLESISSLYAVEGTILATFKELDHSPQRGDAEYWGDRSIGDGRSPQWPKGNGKKIYAYLKPFNTLPALLSELNSAGHSTIIYSDGLPQPFINQFRSRTIRFYDQPLDLLEVAARCDMAIMNAGHGTTSSLLLAGKPILQLPLNLEQQITGANTVKIGAGLSAPELKPEDMIHKLRQLIEDSSYTRGAEAFASRYAGFDRSRQTAKMKRLIESLLQA